MLKRFLLTFAIPMLLTGCAVPAIQPAATLDNPANPNAAEAPLPPPSNTLIVTGASNSTLPANDSTEGMRHDMKGMDMNRGGQPMPGMNHVQNQGGQQ